MKLDPYLIVYTKTITQIKDWNIKAKFINLLKENMSKSFMTLDWATMFCNTKHSQQQKKTDKLDIMNILKIYCIDSTF